jgi:hypothetical protein
MNLHHLPASLGWAKSAITACPLPAQEGNREQGTAGRRILTPQEICQGVELSQQGLRRQPRGGIGEGNPIFSTCKAK